MSDMRASPAVLVWGNASLGGITPSSRSGDSFRLMAAVIELNRYCGCARGEAGVLSARMWANIPLTGQEHSMNTCGGGIGCVLLGLDDEYWASIPAG
jgi:hypothetical protein